MSNWVRTILAIVAGSFAGGAMIALIEAIGHKVVTGDTIFIVTAIGLGIAGLVGGTVAAFIGRNSRLAWVIALLLAGLSLVNVFSFKHPVWFVPVAFILLGLGSGLAFNFHKKRSV